MDLDHVPSWLVRHDVYHPDLLQWFRMEGLAPPTLPRPRPRAPSRWRRALARAGRSPASLRRTAP